MRGLCWLSELQVSPKHACNHTAGTSCPMTAATSHIDCFGPISTAWLLLSWLPLYLDSTYPRWINTQKTTEPKKHISKPEIQNIMTPGDHTQLEAIQLKKKHRPSDPTHKNRGYKCKTKATKPCTCRHKSKRINA